MDMRARARQLRAGQLDGCRFRQQDVIGGCIVDFACRRRRLVVEVDGGQHAEGRKADAARTARLERLGYRVIRFWNHEVLENVEGVVGAILAELRERKGPPSRPPP